MKLRYIFAAICSFALLAVGCTKEDLTSLANIELSQTYVSIPAEGGTVEVTLNAKEDWAFDAKLFYTTDYRKDADGNRIKDESGKYIQDTTYSATPKWLTVEPLSGNAGTTTLKFTAAKYDGGREGELHIICGTSKQYVTVRQGDMTASTATCAEVIAGPDAKTYRVTGTCTGIYNTTYGNWYLNDGTGEITIYGTLNASGATGKFSSVGLEVGDKVTVEGPKSTYNGTTELVDVTVIKIVKSLAKVVTPAATVAKEGAEIEVKLAHKAAGATVTVPEDVDWIKYVSATYKAGVATKIETSPADTTIFKFKVAANDGKPRTADLEFSAGEGSSASVVSYTVSQDGAAGNTLAEVLAMAKGDAVTVDEANVLLVYAKGFIVYDATGLCLVYENAAPSVKAGDKVSVTGTIGQYSGMNQIASPTYKVISSGNTSTLNPSAATADNITEYSTTATAKYVTVKATISTANTYTATVDGSNATLNITYATGVEAPATGSVVNLTAVVYGCYNGKVYMYASAADVDADAPSFGVSATTFTPGAADTEVKFNVTGNVDWTVTCPDGVSASPEDGNGEAEVTLSFNANTEETAKEYAVTVSTEADVATKSYTINIKQDGLAVVYNTIAEVLAAAKDTEVKINDALVVMAYNKGFLAQDATGTVLVYQNATPTAKVGDKVKVVGTVGSYNSANQIASPTVTVLSSDNTVDLGTPSEPTDAQLAEMYTKFEVNYIKATVKLSSSKNYEGYLTADGSTTLLSLYYDSSLTAPEKGSTVILKGLTYGYVSSAKKVVVYVTSCEVDTSAPADAKITVNSTASVEVGKTVELGATVNSGASLSYATSDASVATVSEAGVVTGVADGTATITISAPAVTGYTAATATCTVTVYTPSSGPRTTKTSEHVFAEYEDYASWGTSYSAHTLTYDECSVVFASANKQSATSTINDCPVTKGGAVEIKMNAGRTITAVTFTCKQWGTKAQTITLNTSTNGGTDYTATDVTSSTFTVTADSLAEGVNALKFTFSSSSNQVGLVSVALTYEE